MSRPMHLRAVHTVHMVARVIVGMIAAVLIVSALLPTAVNAQASDDASTFIRQPPGTRVHVVQRGDTLNTIARQYNTTVAQILGINPQITNPNRISVGQRIWIPAAGPQPEPPILRPPAQRPPFSPPIAGDPDADFMFTQVFLLALGDGGASGFPAGCGDSAVGVWVEAAPSQAILRTSLETLLRLGGPFHPQTGFYNALHRSQLTLSNLQLENGVATISLSGRLVADTSCEQAQIRAQLERTALQFSTVNRAEIFINGQRF